MSSFLRMTLLALIAGASACAWALPDDAAQPIGITSIEAELDETTGTAVYRGDVEMTQGSLKVKAETLTIETLNDEVTRILADGTEDTPATYEQQLEAGDPGLVLGRAESIIYFYGESRIELKGDAELAQAGDRFSGERISYDLEARRVRASGGGGEDGERMTFTLDPKRVTDVEEESP